MNWKHGYYADAGYTFGHYPETMPTRLRWAALIQGHDVPVARFRYLDAGCGQGLGLIIAAASHPDSEFVGIDFLPEHIAHARSLAAACGLNNVTFIEGDFVELAENPQLLGEFDFAVCHGITTWIAPAVKKGLFKLIGRALKPGGVFYNSYNTMPGWLPAVPFQHLVLLEQRSKPGALALKTARSHMAHLKQHAPRLFASQPGLQARLDGMEKQDPAYLVQEYNNQYWKPVFVTEMMDDMAAVKLSYLGTATLAEAFASIIPPEIQTLLAEQNDIAVREQLRDYTINQGFRRDLYVKGANRPWRLDFNQQIRNLMLVANPATARPAPGEPYLIKTGSVELSGKPEAYNSLLEPLLANPNGLSVGALMDMQPDAFKNSTVLTLSMLIQGGWVMPINPSGTQKAGRRVNQAFTRAALAGAPYRYLCVPRAGSAITFSDVDWCLLDAYFRGLKSATDRISAVIQGLNSLGRALAQDGKPVTEPDQQQALLTSHLKRFDEITLPLLTRLGAV